MITDDELAEWELSQVPGHYMDSHSQSRRIVQRLIAEVRELRERVILEAAERLQAKKLHGKEK